MSLYLTDLLKTARCGNPGFIECHVAMFIWNILPPVLLVVGTSGNLLSILVLSRKRLRQYSTTVYLLLLAFSDLTVLWTSSLRHTLLAMKKMDIKDMSVFNCRTHEWFAYTSGAFSIWLLVLLTIERTLLIKFPVFAKPRMTPRNAVIASVVTLAIIALLTVYMVFGVRYNTVSVYNNISYYNQTYVIKHRCHFVSESFATFQRRTWKIIQFFVFSLLPLVIIITGNSVIAFTMFLQRRKVHPLQRQLFALNSRRNFATKMLFILSSFFLATTLPFSTFQILLNYKYDNPSSEEFARLQLINVIVMCFLWCNYTFNFFLYFLNGSLFKREWKNIMTEIRRKGVHICHRLWCVAMSVATDQEMTEITAPRQGNNIVNSPMRF